jgi:nucleoside permease NupC
MVPAYYDNRRIRRSLKGITVTSVLPLITESFVLVHLTGMAILVGAFIIHMRSKDNFPFRLMVWGASIQLATGTILVGLAYAGDDAPDNLKITVKALLGVGVLVAAILGSSRQKKGEAKLQPFFHAAGGLAFISLIIAVLWNAELYV